MTALVYEGVPIGRRDEMLCLTDMWRACGADPSKRPAKWREHDSTREFVAYVASSVILIENNECFQTLRGGGGEQGTYAHWQIGLAYAKYLSPSFHAWCNLVVREHMEGHLVPNTRPVALVDSVALAAELGRVMQNAMREELGGAIEPMDRRLTSVESGLDALRRAVEEKRRSFKEETKRDLLRAAHEAGGACPCCKRSRVTNTDGTKAPHAEFHHIVGRSDNSPRNGVPLCKKCHGEFTAEPAKLRAECLAPSNTTVTGGSIFPSRADASGLGYRKSC